MHGFISLRRNIKYFKNSKCSRLVWKIRHRNKIKVLRTNIGGEFYRNEFEEFYKKCVIERKKTNIYTPQQNGFPKGMNKTLMKKARSMISGIGLGQEF